MKQQCLFLEMLMQITAEARALDFSLNVQKIHDILTQMDHSKCCIEAIATGVSHMTG